MRIETLAQTPATVTTKQARPEPVEPSSVERPILPTGSLFDAVAVVLDLSRDGRDLMSGFNSLNPTDQSVYLEVISSVLQAGVVGRETVEVNGQPRETYVTTRMGDEQLRHAPAYRGRRLDVTA